MSETNYIPGVCNINTAEIAYRKKAFYLGLAMGIPLLLVLVAFKATPALGILMFMPVWIGAIGYLQAKNKFCVGYAASGVYNDDDEYAKVAKVFEEESKRLGQAKARKMNVQALLIGALGAATSTLILSLI